MKHLHPQYITGLVEGEGSFSISFSLRSKLSVGIETRPSFSITLNQRDLELLKLIHTYFSCGAIRYSKGDRTYKYEIRSIKEIVKHILPHFDSYALHGAKRKDYDIFKAICLKIHRNLHLNADHLSEIISDAYMMNPSGKRKHTKQYLLQTLTR